MIQYIYVVIGILFNSYIAEIDFRRQILTSEDYTRSGKNKIFVFAVEPYNIGIQMSQNS